MSLDSLKDHPKFVLFARKQFGQYPDVWRAEAESAPPGIFKALAVAICEIADVEND